jgi:hypothetical protein
MSDFESSYKNMYELALQYSNYSYDDLSDDFKSYFLGEYLNALARSDGDFSDLDLTGEDANYDYASTIFGLMKIAQDEDLTKDNDEYNTYAQQELLLDPVEVEVEVNPDGTIKDKEGQDPSQTASDLADILKGDTTKTDETLSDKVEPQGEGEGQTPSKTASDLVNVLKGTTDKTDGDVSDKTDTSKTAEDLVTIIENKSAGSSEVKDELRQLSIAESGDNALITTDLTTDTSQVVSTDQSIAASYSMNNQVNILQQTDYMGSVEFVQKDMDKNINEVTVIKNDYAQYNGIEIYHIDGSDNLRKMSNEEWRHIVNSYNYDKNFAMTDELKKLYGSTFSNEIDYYTTVAMGNNNFRMWLSDTMKGIEGRSFLKAISNAPSGINFTNHNRDYNNKKRDVEIKEVENMGISNIGSFLMSSAISCFFSTIILRSIKQISNTPVIQQYESASNGSADLLASGLYSNTNKLNELLKENPSLNKFSEAQRKMINLNMQSKSYKNLSQYRISNRYGQIINSFFGSIDDRQHSLLNNTGIVLFNIVLTCLGYIACYMDQNLSVNIDMDITSNLVKIISNILAVFYPADKYDPELIRGIDLILRIFKNEIRNIHRGTGGVNLQQFMKPIVYDLIHICFNMTASDFNIERFITPSTREHIINNFGSMLYYSLSTIDTFVNIIIEGFVDNQQFNEGIKNLMVVVLSEHYEYNGVQLFDVFFMNSVQAMMFLNNDKKNHLVSVLHPDLVQVSSIIPKKIRIITFEPEIIGYISYTVPDNVPVYDTYIKEKIETYNPFEEPFIFSNEEEAEKHKQYINDKVGAEVFKEVVKKDDDEQLGFIVGTDEEREKFQAIGLSFIPINYDAVQNGGRNDDIKGIITPLESIDINNVQEDSNEKIDLANTNIHKVEDYQAIQLLNFISKNYDDEPEVIKNKLNDIITTDSMIFIDEVDKNYVIIKEKKNNKLYVIFTGSRTIDDWMINSNIEFSGNNHQGIENKYNEMKDKLFKNINQLNDDKTEIFVYAHSKGHGFSTHFVNDMIDINKKIRAVSFGGFDVLQDSKQLNEKLKNNAITFINYMATYDAIDYVNNAGIYGQVGDKMLIDIKPKTLKIKGISEVQKLVFSKKLHSTDSYKKLLKGDKYVNYFTKIKKYDEIKETVFSDGATDLFNSGITTYSWFNFFKFMSRKIPTLFTATTVFLPTAIKKLYQYYKMSAERRMAMYEQPQYLLLKNEAERQAREYFTNFWNSPPDTMEIRDTIEANEPMNIIENEFDNYDMDRENIFDDPELNRLMQGLQQILDDN